MKLYSVKVANGTYKGLVEGRIINNVPFDSIIEHLESGMINLSNNKLRLVVIKEGENGSLLIFKEK
jgi:hypothetical protein